MQRFGVYSNQSFCTKNRMFESHSIFKQFLAIFISFVVISVTKMRRKLTSLGTCCFFSHVNRKYKNHIELNFLDIGSNQRDFFTVCHLSKYPLRTPFLPLLKLTWNPCNFQRKNTVMMWNMGFYWNFHGTQNNLWDPYIHLSKNGTWGFPRFIGPKKL